MAGDSNALTGSGTDLDPYQIASPLDLQEVSQNPVFWASGVVLRLETDLDRQKLAAMTREIGLSDVPEAASAILAGQVRGRIVVKIE